MSTDGIRTDWANKDFYAELGVTKKATHDEIKKAYRKLARANHPDSNPGDTAKHEKFKAVAEAYDVIGDEEKRKKYDEVRELYGGGGFREASRAARPRAAASTSTTCCATAPAAEASATCSATSSAAGGRQQARTRADARRRRRDQRDDQLHGRHGRRHDQPAADLRHRLPGVPRHRRQAGHDPEDLSRVRGRRLRGQLDGRRVLDQRDLPPLRRTPARVRRGLPDLPRLRPRLVGADDPGAHPRRRQGRPAHPAARQGRSGRERRRGRRPLRHRQGDPAPALRAARGDNLTARRTGVVRRGRARRRDQDPDAGRQPGHAQDPGRHPDGRTFRVRGRGAQKKDGTKGDLLATVEVQVPARLNDAAREAIAAYRAAGVDGTLRANLFEQS